jgi:hypothetical protein
MNRDACLAALEAYRTSVERIAGCLAAVEPSVFAGAARVLLDDLEFLVQVDLDARTTVAGAERMSDIEAALFVPTLKTLQCAAAATLAGRASTQWLPALATMDATLRDATSQARAWGAESA